MCGEREGGGKVSSLGGKTPHDSYLSVLGTSPRQRRPALSLQHNSSFCGRITLG